MKKVHAGKALMPDQSIMVAALTKDAQLTLARPLLQLISEAMDEAISVGAVWISIGVTRKVDAIVLTVHQADDTIAIYADSVVKLLEEVPSLL